MSKKSAQKKTNWKTTDKRFVAFLDLLGFKDKVMRLDHELIYDELTRISNYKKRLEEVTIEAKDTYSDYFMDVDVYLVSFSDSIVIFSKNDTYENFEFFLTSVRYFFSQLIIDKIAVKGGIAYGEISVNKSEQIYFGQPIIDAYLIEEEVNYLGVTCHNSIDEFLEKNRELVKKSSLIEGLLCEHKTPLKSGRINHLNIDWFNMIVSNNSKEDARVKLIRDNIRSFNSTVSGNPRRYVDNTIGFFLELVDEKKVNFERLKPTR